MTEKTVKPGLTRKRPKRVRDNNEFDALTRRILRAYARRVAAGDIEALRSLATLSAELDAALRLAVVGLKQFYSWSEIADRLGVSRQAAQMRFGDKADRGALDRRLVEAGLNITVSTLVAVFAEHHPGNPPASVCPGCGYRYPDGQTDCPTNATVRPLLVRRRAEDKPALDRLSWDQRADLLDPKVARKNRVATGAQAANTAASPGHTAPNLLSFINERG